MNALVFLGIAAGLSLVGCLVLWFRSRQPRSMDAHIRDFARELDALAPGSPVDRPRPRPGPRFPDDNGRRPARPPQRSGAERPPTREVRRRPG